MIFAAAFAILLAAENGLALECRELVSTTKPYVSTEYSRGVLWRIESLKGRVNYVFGTIHLADARVTELPKVTTDALLSSQRFVMEVVLDFDAIGAMSEAMVFRGNEDLKDTLDPALYTRTVQLLGRHGMSASAVRHLKPWAAYTTLSVPSSQTGTPLDLVLANMAASNSIEIFGLESIEEQIALFDTMTIAQQVELLTQVVCHYDDVQAEIEQIVEHYVDQDIDAMMRLSERHSSVLNDRLMDAVLWQRNRLMVERMQSHLLGGRSFIAAGALHLPGRGGVLDLLAKRGYIVTPVH